MPRDGVQIVLTVHGVSPDRTWQDRAAKALEPHFRCIPITYRHYGSPLGAVAVVFNLTAYLALGAVWFFAPAWRSPLRASALAVATIALSVALARVRRTHVVDVVKAQISRKATQRQPHVIAHSFGTYICGSALQKFKDLRFGRIVLIGSILPETFNWRSIRRSRPDAFLAIRNDIGLSDLVVWLVKRVGRLALDLGTSGLSGFVGDPRVVHRSSRAWGPCLACLHSGRRPLIHDIFLAKYRHSDWALGPGHARELWLPYLWGYSPREFNEFIECCRDAAYARQEHFWQDLDIAEERLRERTWTWTRNQPLQVFVAGELDSLIRRSETQDADLLRRHRVAIIDNAFISTYLAIGDAYEESANVEEERTPERDLVILALNPQRGIAKALDKAIRTVRPETAA